MRFTAKIHDDDGNVLLPSVSVVYDFLVAGSTVRGWKGHFIAPSNHGLQDGGVYTLVQAADRRGRIVVEVGEGASEGTVLITFYGVGPPP